MLLTREAGMGCPFQPFILVDRFHLLSLRSFPGAAVCGTQGKPRSSGAIALGLTGTLGTSGEAVIKDVAMGMLVSVNFPKEVDQMCLI